MMKPSDYKQPPGFCGCLKVVFHILQGSAYIKTNYFHIITHRKLPSM